MLAVFQRRSITYWRWVLVVAWMGVIFFLSSRQTLPDAEGISAEVQSIAGHFVAYAVLAVLVVYALSDVGISTARRMVFAFVFAVIYGITDEFHQSFVPGRDASVFDLAVDAIGALAALLGWRFVERRRRRTATN